MSILPNHHLSSFLKKVIGSFKVSKFVPSPGPSPAGPGSGSRFPGLLNPAAGETPSSAQYSQLFESKWTQRKDEADLTLSSHQSIIFNKNKICFRSKHPVMMISNNNLDKSHHQPHHDHRRDLTKRRKVDLCISSKPLCIPELSLSA